MIINVVYKITFTENILIFCRSKFLKGVKICWQELFTSSKDLFLLVVDDVEAERMCIELYKTEEKVGEKLFWNKIDGWSLPICRTLEETVCFINITVEINVNFHEVFRLHSVFKIWKITIRVGFKTLKYINVCVWACLF